MMMKGRLGAEMQPIVWPCYSADVTFYKYITDEWKPKIQLGILVLVAQNTILLLIKPNAYDLIHNLSTLFIQLPGY